MKRLFLPMTWDHLHSVYRSYSAELQPIVGAVLTKHAGLQLDIFEWYLQWQIASTSSCLIPNEGGDWSKRVN